MQKSLFTSAFIIFYISFFSQNYIGFGNGIRFNELENLKESTYSKYELDYNKANYFGQLLVGREFSNDYHQELRLTYKSTVFNENKHIAGITGSYDTSSVEINSFNISNQHSLRFFKKVPLYGIVGINFKRYTNQKIHNHGVSYSFSIIPNDTILVGNTYNYSYSINPKLWGVGTLVGLQYKKRLSKNTKLYIETLYESDVKQLNMIEDVFVRNFQSNVGLILQYGGIRESDSLIRTKPTGNNNIEIAYGYRLFNDGYPKNSFNLNLNHRIAKSKFYLGYGGGVDIENSRTPLYRLNVSSEFRLVDEFSISVSPGVYMPNDGSGYSFSDLYLDNSFNFVIDFNSSELIPFTGFRFIQEQTNLIIGCKFRLKA